jgi:hypothetical protein
MERAGQDCGMLPAINTRHSVLASWGAHLQRLTSVPLVNAFRPNKTACSSAKCVAANTNAQTRAA